MPVPTTYRRMLPGCQAPTAEAPGGAATLLSFGGTKILVPLPVSRRATAAAAQTIGAVAGESPLTPSHERKALFMPPVFAAALPGDDRRAGGRGAELVPRCGDREPAVRAEPAASEGLGPADPAEPVVSANATGSEATAEPTPNATASAPTRPM